MSDIIYWEDMQQGQVIELGSVTITYDEIIDFATKFDPQPFHLDEEAAKHSIFEGLAASGWHTAALFMRLMVDNLVNHTVSMGSPGVDEIRWLRPVRPGDTLHGQFNIVETNTSRSRPQMGIVRSRGEMYNQHDQLVMTLTAIGFFGRKPTDS